MHVPAAATADVCDANPSAKVLQCWFSAYGGKAKCAGPVETITTRDDNSLVKTILAEQGAGRVLVIDNKASTNCAMIGGNLAAIAEKNGWAGIVVNGAVRDVDELKATPIAIFALATCPKRSLNRGIGERGGAVRMGGERINHEDFLVADADGVVVLPSWSANGGQNV
ncbi:MAG: ribonuclease E activity regulator RraA [Woeseiaceae bacterium]